MRIVVLLFILLIIPAAASGQLKTFKWQSELCERTGVYDSRIYSERQLRDTLKLFGVDAVRYSYDSAVWNYEDIAKLDVGAIDRDFAAKTKTLRDLNVVKRPFWERLRKAALAESEQVHELSRITAQAYTQPEILNAYSRAESCKLKYAGPLIDGGESLAEVWLEVNLTSRNRNADPKRLKERFDQENSSPDRLKYARVETMSFGWWNCAIDHVERPKQADDGTADEEFRKLFKRIKEVCDEA